MQRMALTSPRTPTDEAHEAEVAQQTKIAEELQETDQVPADAVPDNPEADAAPVTEEAPKVTLRSIPDAVEEYPLSVSVVGVDEELVFDGADSTIEVSPQVAEQVTYLPNVEVAA
jgi:hypothetical protein